MNTIEVFLLIYARCKSVVGDVKVYDDVPEKAPYPYVQIGRSVAQNADYHDVEGERIMVYLSIFSAFPGREEVATLIEQIKPVFRRYRGPLLDETDNQVGFVSYMRVRNTSITRDADGKTYTGQITLEMAVQQS